jgi:hypothetical protein
VTRLLVAISHHGLGHLAQAAPVLNALHAARPDLEFVVWSGVAQPILASRISAPFRHRHEAADVGLAMHDPVRVDLAASRAVYLEFHRDWEARVAREADWLRAQDIGGVLSDVACLPLAAAARAGIPGVAMCSLNWVDIAAAYLAEQPGMAAVLEQLAAAYRSARAFLCVTPGMPMDWLENRESVPPITARGVARREELRAGLGMARDERLILIGFGGIAYQAARPLPALDGVRWLVPDDWRRERADLISFSRAGLPFLDLLASSDALVTKVGYGSFVEAAVAGLPVLYIDRPDWPETPYLAEWLRDNTPSEAIAEADLFEPGIAAPLDRLRAAERMPAVAAPGAEHAARRVLELILNNRG